jgi:MFS family permease
MPTRPAVWTSRLTTPGAGAFAVLFGLQALSRALVTVALSVQTMEIMGSDEGVSTLFLIGSVAALCIAFVIPRLAEWMGRARLCSLAILLVAASLALFVLREPPSQVAGFVLRTSGVAILFAVLSMFIMDHVRRDELGRAEPLRMLSVGMAWAAGPFLGVQIEKLWGPWAPFAASGAVAFVLLIYFWVLRFRNLPIVRSANPPLFYRPFANLADFLAQPRLVLAWLQALGRVMFWASFVIYTPLFAVETGLGADMGGLLISLGSGFMLLMPLWGWAARRFGIRRVSLIAFPVGAASMTAAGLLSAWPWFSALFVVCSACAMTAIDGYGNALFFRACKPSQRMAMTPVFSAHRDLANIAQAGIFAVLLSFFPVKVVFLILGLVLFGLTLLSIKIHGRL